MQYVVHCTFLLQQGRERSGPKFCFNARGGCDHPRSALRSKALPSVILDMMMFRWPASYESDKIPTLGLPNHASSYQHPEAVCNYLDKELKEKALIGPFSFTPFNWFRTNPLMVRAKKDPCKFQVILDLSFPLGESVNSYILSLSFDGAPYKLRLPSALHMAELIAKHGKGCYIYKLDLAWAYRQLPYDPLDWPLLGLFWDKKFYVDKSVPFGCAMGRFAVNA